MTDEAVRFGLDGADYESDLSKRHATQLRAALADYTAARQEPPVGAVAQSPAVRGWIKP